MRLQHKLALLFIATVSVLALQAIKPQQALAVQDCRREADVRKTYDIGDYHYIIVKSAVSAVNVSETSTLSPYNVIDSRFCGKGDSDQYDGSGGGSYGGSMTGTADRLDFINKSGVFNWDNGAYGSIAPIHMELGFGPAAPNSNGIGTRGCVPLPPELGIPVARCSNYQNEGGVCDIVTGANCKNTSRNAASLDDAGRLVIRGKDGLYTIWCNNIRTNTPPYKDCGPDILERKKFDGQLYGNSGALFRADQTCPANLGYGCFAAGSAEWAKWYLGPWSMVKSVNMDSILSKNPGGYITGLDLHYEAHNVRSGGFGAGNSWTLKYPKNKASCKVTLSNVGPLQTATAKVEFTNTGTRPWWSATGHVITGGPSSKTWVISGIVKKNGIVTITDTFDLPMSGTTNFTYQLKQRSGVITTPTPCTREAPVNGNVGCSGLTQSTFEPNTSFFITPKITYSSGPPTSSAFKITHVYLEGDTIETTFTGLAKNQLADPGSIQVDPGPTGTASATFTSLAGGTAGKAKVVWTYDSSLGPTVTCEDTITIAARPYLKVYGGDVMAGSGFRFNTSVGSENCATNGNAGILGVNKNGTPNFAGAGTQLAAFAMAAIDQFASGDGQGANMPRNLTFANSDPSDSSFPAFGGNFDYASCIPDYYGAAEFATGKLDFTASKRCFGLFFNPCVFDVDHIGGNSAIYGNLNGRVVYRVTDSNAYITGNVMLAGGPWASPSDIPSFYLIVKGGDIYIDLNVTRLDGVYIAEPVFDDVTGVTTGGNIYTCTSGSTRLPPEALYAVLAGPVCQQRLTVNGAFAANQVYFLRVFGSLNLSTPGETNTTTQAAEVFNYSPALWLSSPFQPPPTGSLRAATTLPPIL